MFDSVPFVQLLELQRIGTTVKLQIAERAEAEDLRDELRDLKARYTEEKTAREAADAARVELAQELATVKELNARLESDIHETGNVAELKREIATLEERVWKSEAGKELAVERLEDVTPNPNSNPNPNPNWKGSKMLPQRWWRKKASWISRCRTRKKPRPR